MAKKDVAIHIQTTADAKALKEVGKDMAATVEATEGAESALEKFGLSLQDLQGLLKRAKEDFAAAAPGTKEYDAAVTRVGELSGRINEILKPLRGYAEAQAKAAAETAKTTAAVKAATQAQEQLNKAQQRQDAVAGAHRQFAADLREAELSTARLFEISKKHNEEQRKVPGVQNQAAASTRNSGMAVLEMSRGLEDMQYGIHGVVNNIPSLVMAMGGGMGLAGVISVAAVAVAQLVKHFGEAKAASEKLSWAEMTPDEAAVKRMEDFNVKLGKRTEEINSQAAAWERLAEAQKAATERQKEHDAYLSEKAKQGDVAGDPQQTLQEYDVRKRQRERQIADEELATTGKKVETDRRIEDAARLEQASRDQAARVAELEKLGEVEKQIEEQQQRVKESQEKLWTAEGGARGMLPSGDRARMQAEIQTERDALKRLQEAQRSIVGPDAKITGDPEKDAEARKAAMDREREQDAKLKADAKAALEAARAAGDEQLKAERELQARRAKMREEQELDDDKTEQQVAREAGLPVPMPRLPGQPRDANGRTNLLDPGVRSLLTRPKAAPGPQEEAPEDPAYTQDKQNRQDFANEATGNVVASLQQLKQQTQNPEIQKQIQEVLTSLTDRDGATKQDLEQALAYLRTSQQGNAENSRLVLELTRSTGNAIDALRGDLQAGLAEMRGRAASSRF